MSSSLCESFYNEEQRELQRTTKKLIETEINPYVEQWEREQIFPAKEVFKAFGQAGLLGINKPQAQVIPLLLIQICHLLYTQILKVAFSFDNFLPIYTFH